MGKLTVTEVRNAKPIIGIDGQPRKRVLVDGMGLMLVVAPSGARNWVLRVQEGKTASGKPRRRDIGLGSADTEGAGRRAFPQNDSRLTELPLMLRKVLTLAEAREKAAALRKLAKAGADPVLERDRERKAIPTFAEAVTATHDALKSGWNDKTAKAFLASLEFHAVPKLGALRVDAIGANDIILALAPIWTEKAVTASKVRHRIGMVLAFAKSRGWRTEAPPDAREMRSGLPKQAAGGHFEAMPYADVPVFIGNELGKELGASRAATLFAILTASRSGAVRKATWEQIDLEAREWHCPADIMKKQRAHDVALSSAAIALLEQYTPKELRSGLIFRGVRDGSLSDMSLTKVLRQAKRGETLHGFRSSFRDWAAERMPHIPFMVAQMALSHAVGSATDRAYLRTDMLEMRRALMEAWGQFAAPSLSVGAGNVVPLQRVSGS
ncbi:site-specific integrase [Novosphingobium umbonatum]|uniref:Site-specific integrase n=1 Tax=Novosphingobium umbonatum TaxID=1908524 RepID=A0A3S2UT06_9SPHN|nr:site-specific integrase [Novosphingobium umbonatum]RVU04122.1 site-specific integrase [Novosphingobium umbonatum]